MDGRMFGGEHFGSPLRSPERRGESCIRPLCSIRPYAQKLRLHRVMLYGFRRSTRNPIRAYPNCEAWIMMAILSFRKLHQRQTDDTSQRQSNR
uniref:Uncharacterized protein n=1 Tax=Candidatus Kentrum sp. FM TaxID=2126340 RepID=A0A450U1W1_9GAMM|nr:MAG: hypothetical protein BECKFM1743A_GA0114220_109402 [Candidatus Kentron sp. FM]